MFNLFAICLFALMVWGQFTTDEQEQLREVGQEILEKPAETFTFILERAANASTRVPCCDMCGTTRCVTFRREFDESAAEMDERMRGVPLGLRLPSGETVYERINNPRSAACK